MARPQKKGLDYFPLDVTMWDDIRVRKVNAKFGSKGIVVLLRIYTEIYREGYYLRMDDDDTLLLIADLCPRDVSEEEVGAMVEFMLKIGLFDKDMHHKYRVLTSRAIQERYLTAKKAGKNLVNMDEFLLIELEKDKNECKKVSSEKTGVFSEETQKNGTDFDQSSEDCKERKEPKERNKRKEKESKEIEEEIFFEFGKIEIEEAIGMDRIEQILTGLTEEERKRAMVMFQYGADMRLKVLEEIPVQCRGRAFLLMEALEEYGITDANKVKWFEMKSGFGREGTPIWMHLANIRNKPAVKDKLSYLMTCMMNEKRPATAVG